MKVRSLDANKDWNLGRGMSDYFEDLNAIKQNIQTRIKSFYQNCFFDTLSGIDWFNLLGQRNNVLAIELAVSKMILETTGITQINSLNVSVNEQREVTLTYSVNTIYGTIDSTSVGVP